MRDTELHHLVARVREAIAEDPRTNVLDVRVSLQGEAVRVAGDVASEERRRLIIEVAREQVPAEIELQFDLRVRHYRGPGRPEEIG